MQYNSAPKKLPKVISFEEATKLIKKTKNPRHKLAFSLGFLTCLRVSEVAKLLPEDVNLDRGMLFIRDAKGGKDGFHGWINKTHSYLLSIWRY